MSEGTILIVDDDQGLREVLAETLREAGYEVATAGDAGQALETLASESLDAVVSDICMPGLSGMDLLRAVRARDPDLPVVLVTGSPSLETAIEAVALGAFKYLTKPVLGADLRAALDRAVGLRRMARLNRMALAFLGGEERQRKQTGAALDEAIARLWVAYQPIVRAADGSPFGYEALMRSEGELATPAAILSAAERLQRLPDLGRAMRRAVAEGPVIGSGQILFMNLHPLDLLDQDLFDPSGALGQAAATTILEITERSTLDAVPDVRARVGRLREMGFRIAVDDLGAGYAGLSTLISLEPEIVKLDISLVRGMGREPVKRKLVETITALCRDLRILVLAEGIETEEDRLAGRDVGCDLLQGFHIGRPLPAAALSTASTRARP
jgi:EAL domain-containing protein (putative c-di-GMP-specific phosphodiesterase class I)